MYKTTVKIDGMMCSMCEAHMNEAIRKSFPTAKKVSSSHTKGVATFLTKEPVDEEKLRNGIEETGYHYLASKTEVYEKKGLFGRF